jgi:hypothetical protein
MSSDILGVAVRPTTEKIHDAGARGWRMPRPALQHALLGVGVLCLLAATLVGGGGPSDADYVHHVEVASDDELAYGLTYDASDVVAYENLSARGQAAFDRARADSPYVVANESATAPDFSYTSDHVAVGEGLYPVRYEGTVYSLRTERESAGVNVAALFAGLALRGVGIVLVVGGVLLAGWRRYQRGAS